jgi:hypothetical protein
MSELQQGLDLDVLLPTDTGESQALNGPDIHALSLGDELIDWNQYREIIEPPGTSSWYGQQAEGRTLESINSLGGWHQGSSRFVKAARTGSVGTEVEQSWLQHQYWETDQFMQTFEQDMAQDKDLGVPHEPTFREACPSDNLGSINLDKLGLSFQSLDTRDQISATNVACSELDRQVSNIGYMCGKLCSIKLNQTLQDWELHPDQARKKYSVKRLGGSQILDRDGNLVDSLAMETYKDVAAFIGCTVGAVSNAMKRKGNKRGIILKRWKVEQCDATGKDGRQDSGSCSVVQLTPTTVFPIAEEFWSQQQTQQAYTASEQDPSCTYGVETTLSGTCSTYGTSGHLEQDMSQVRLITNHHLQLSEIPAPHPVSSNEPILMGQDASPCLEFHGFSDSGNMIHSLNMEDISSQDTAFMVQLPEDAIESQGSIANEGHVRRHACTQADPHQTMLPAAISCTSHTNKHHIEVPEKGRPVRHYRVSQVDGHGFKFRGIPVTYVMICTTKAVAAITGISTKTLEYVKKNVDIQWAQWKITYIKKAHCNHVAEQGLLEENNTTLVRSEWSEVGALQSLQAYIESRHASSIQEDRMDMENQYEGYEVPYGQISTIEAPLENSLVSTHPVISARDLRSSDIEGMVGNAKEVVLHTKRKRRPLSVANKINLRNSAINNGRAKLYHVTRVDGTSFRFGRKQVTSARIWSSAAVGQLLNCTQQAISQALVKQGEKEVIVKKEWKIKSLGKACRSA